MKSIFVGAMAWGLLSLGFVRADGVKPGDHGELIDFKKDVSAMLSYENGATGTADADLGVLKLTLPAGKGYPGVKVSPAGMWDLTGYTGVDAEVTNTGTDNLNVNLRVDGDDDWKNQTWNCEMATVSPGQTLTIHVTFGMSYKQPAYKMPLDHVLHVLVFALDPAAAGSLKIKSIKATK